MTDGDAKIAEELLDGDDAIGVNQGERAIAGRKGSQQIAQLRMRQEFGAVLFALEFDKRYRRQGGAAN